jgi:putative ABC transport system permease protein
MHPVVQNLRYGIRLFQKSPGFSAMALATLALGMGATTAIFSIVDAVLLKPLPFRDPGRLLVIWEKNAAQNRTRMFVPPADYREWQRQSASLESLAAIESMHANLTAGPNGRMEPEELRGERVTASLFPLLGVQPVLGRGFRPEEDRPGHSGYVVLSYGLWTRRFGADRSIPGKAVQLGSRSYTVLGVLPAGFAVVQPGVDMWLPLALDAADARASAGRTLMVVARLKPGVAIEKAGRELDAIGSGLEQANPTLNSGWRPSVYPLQEEVVGKVRDPLLVLMAAVGFLLLMGCANVANLLLARAGSRRREVAIRTAMGAGRGSIIVQLLGENLLLAGAGGAAGLVLARVGIALLEWLGPANIPRLSDARVDARLFLFALASAAVTGLLVGIVPAIQISSGNLNSVLTETGRGGTMSRSGRAVRNLLVVGEIALAVVVLIGAGLLMRSFAHLRSASPGFQPAGLLTARLPLAGGRNAAAPRRVEFIDRLLQQVSALPGVLDAGAVNSLPLAGFGVGSSFAVYGRPAPPPDQRPIGLMRAVTVSYFRTMGIRLVAGREFSIADTGQSQAVIIVNRTLARLFWPGASGPAAALGGRLLFNRPNGKGAEIVGVVSDVKADRIEGEEWPTIYNPYTQYPAVTMTAVVRTAGPPLAMTAALQREVHLLDPDQPVADVRPMEDVVDRAIAEPRFNAMVLAVFALIAFVLAAVGIYGVISYDVSSRTHEIGIRMALGAQRSDLLRMTLGQGARLAAYGIVAGLAAAFGLTRLMTNMLYEVKATDADTFAAIALLLGGVALAASYLPSRRAMALDPVNALRHE